MLLEGRRRQQQLKKDSSDDGSFFVCISIGKSARWKSWTFRDHGGRDHLRG